MAKMKNGILGSISGKIGPVIGGTWKGISYLKVAPVPTKGRVPSTAQQLHHKKFSFLTKWLQPLHQFVLVGYSNLAINTTEINAAFSYIFKAALKVAETAIYIEHENVLLSRGKLKGIANPQLVLLNENTLELTWQSQSGRLSAYNDQLLLVLYNDEIGVADGLTGGIKRATNTCTFTFDQNLAGKSFHVYVAMLGLNGHENSDSQYLGKVLPL